MLCHLSLELIFKAKLKLESGNQKIQYGHQAAILKVTSLKINRLLCMTTINMHMKFKIEIPKQTWLTSRNLATYRVQKPNKANLRDLIAATGLVILLKFDPNHRFFSPCDLEIWCMISKNNRAPLLYYIKLCVSFQIHRWIQTKVTLGKRSIRVEIGDFLSLVTLKFDGWPWKIIGHLFYTTSSFGHHFKSIGELKLKLQSRNAKFGSKSAIFCPLWPWNLTDALEKQ